MRKKREFIYASLSSLLRNNNMVSLNFNILLVLVIALMFIASAGGIRKIPVKQEQMVDDISGDAAFDSMKTSHKNAQVDSQMVKKNKRSPLGTNHFPEQNHERSKIEESKEFANAEDEVAELMSKDYTGNLRRKPPIHN
ncbi:hypothetical protein P3S68_018519 [Capsicum galapagoense]